MGSTAQRPPQDKNDHCQSCHCMWKEIEEPRDYGQNTNNIHYKKQGSGKATRSEFDCGFEIEGGISKK